MVALKTFFFSRIMPAIQNLNRRMYFSKSKMTDATEKMRSHLLISNIHQEFKHQLCSLENKNEWLIMITSLYSWLPCGIPNQSTQKGDLNNNITLFVAKVLWTETKIKNKNWKEIEKLKFCLWFIMIWQQNMFTYQVLHNTPTIAHQISFLNHARQVELKSYVSSKNVEVGGSVDGT